MGVLITPMALTHPLHPIRSRLRNTCRNLWVGYCVSSWRTWFRPLYSIYYIHTIYYSCALSNENQLFLRDIHTENLCGYDGVLDDMILLFFPVLFPIYICIVQDSIYHNMDIGTMWHWALVSCTPSQSIGLLFECVLFWCWLSIYGFLLLFLWYPLYHHDIQHDNCDYYWDFYGHYFHFELHV